MTIFACYKKGIGDASARLRIVPILWAANLLLAAPVFILFSNLFGSALDGSGRAAGLMTKADMNVIFEFLTAPGRPLNVLWAELLFLVAVFVLAGIFLQGGILRGLADDSPQGRSARVFFYGGAYYYWRFFRLAVYSLILWIPAILLFGVLNALLSAATKDSTREQLMFYLSLFKVALAFFLVYLIKMIMDYARIRIASGDSSKVFQALRASIRFVFGRPGGTLGLYYLLGLTGAAMALVWRLAVSALPATSMPAVWTGFVLTQLFIAGRGWLQVAYQAAQWTNFRTHDQGSS
jgi:hypothetical protein